MSSPVAGAEADQRYTLTPRECRALRLLYRDGWEPSVLEMVFETTSIWAHVNGECAHVESGGDA